MIGIKAPEQIAIPGVRNDLAFLTTVVGVSSVAAVLVGQLPGDWGGFGAYLVGGIPIVVLAIGSTAPGLLSFFTVSEEERSTGEESSRRRPSFSPPESPRAITSVDLGQNIVAKNEGAKGTRLVAHTPSSTPLTPPLSF
jgi:hypothetical protein